MHMQSRLIVEQQQQQQLRLTVEMRQSIAMLQLDMAELASYLNEVSLENPLIDIELPIQWSGSYEPKYVRRSSGTNDPASFVPDGGISMQESLLRQLGWLHISNSDYKIAQFLVGNIDDSGYLAITTEETAVILNCSISEAEHALCLLQTLDPAGIAARTLRECLLLQIRRDPKAPVHAAQAVQDYLEPLAKSQFPLIAKALGVPNDEVRRILHYVRTLNPRPGLQISSAKPMHVVSDAVVALEGDSLAIELRDDLLPVLAINTMYLNDPEIHGDRIVSMYFAEKAREAKAILRGLEKRKLTLYKVIEAVFSKQSEFLRTGTKALLPITLATIADETNLHVSTVSRAVQNKYVQTPWGVYELKHFFTTKINGIHGSDTSDAKIKARLRAIIDSENKSKPLSDQAIAEQLQAEGWNISRRTITKYRKELNILPTLYRKNQSSS